MFVRIELPLDVLGAVVPIEDPCFARQTHVEGPRRWSSNCTVTTRVRIAFGVDRKQADEVPRTIGIVRFVKARYEPERKGCIRKESRAASRKREHRFDGGASLARGKRNAEQNKNGPEETSSDPFGPNPRFGAKDAQRDL